MRILKFFFYLITLCIAGLSSTNAQAERVLWPMDVIANRITLAGELSFDFVPDQTLYPRPDAGLDDSQPHGLLHQYFLTLKKGDVDQLSSLYTDSDGSRDRFTKDLSNNPKRYDGFRKLEQVTLQGVSHWGQYRIHYVSITGDGRTMRWHYPLLCIDSCKLSNFLNHIDESNSIYLNAIGDFTHKVPAGNAQQLTTTVRESELIAQGNSVPVHPGQLDQNDTSIHPLVFYPAVRTVKGEVELPADGSARIEDNLQGIAQLKPLVNFITAASSLEIEPYAGQLYPDKVMELFASHWEGFGKGSTIRTNEMNSGGPGGNELIGDYHGPMAYLDRVRQWRSLDLAGVYESDQYGYLYFFANGGSARSSLQSVAYVSSGDGWTLSIDAQDTAVGTVMQSSHMLNKIAAMVRRK